MSANIQCLQGDEVRTFQGRAVNATRIRPPVFVPERAFP